MNSSSNYMGDSSMDGSKEKELRYIPSRTSEFVKNITEESEVYEQEENDDFQNLSMVTDDQDLNNEWNIQNISL